MTTYFILETVTREGMMTVSEAPARSQGVVNAGRHYGVEVSEFYYTLGAYDFVMKVEAPDDESVAAFTMSLRRSGNVTAHLLRAFPPSEWAAIVDRLPSS